MTTTQVAETSVTVNNNSSIQDYVHPDDQTQTTFVVLMLYILLNPQFLDTIPFQKVIGDHLGTNLGIILGLGIISGSESFQGLYRTLQKVTNKF